MIRRWLTVVACVAVLLPMAIHAQEEIPTDRAISVDDAGNGDAVIDRRLEDIYDALDGLRGIFVTVRSGVVTLRGRVAERAMAERAVEIARRVDGVVAVRNEITEVTSLEERLVPVAERIENRFWQMVGFVPLFAVAAFAGGLVFLFGLWLSRRRWPWDRIAPNAFIADLLRQLVRLGFLVAGLVLALDIVGATALLGTILGAAGIVGLAIGFAVRDTVENYIASVLLSLRQPFRPKDYIAIDGFEGSVIRLTSRATILMDASGNHIRIPNATVFKGNIINYSRNPERRFDITIGIAPDSDSQQALSLGVATLTDLDFVLGEPGPDGWIDGIGASTIDLFFAGWIDQRKTSFVKARSEAIRQIIGRLDAAGISMPVPTYRLEGEPPVKAPQTAKTGIRRQTPAATAEVADTTVDTTIEDRIEEERATHKSDDLLRRDAPTEL